LGVVFEASPCSLMGKPLYDKIKVILLPRVSMEPSFEVLIAAQNAKISNFERSDLKAVDVLVVNQSTASLPVQSKGKLRFLSFQETGIAMSRNRALENAKGDILLISDDDVTFPKGAFQRIEKAFEDNPEFDILTFQVQTPSGAAYRRYPTDSFEHNRFTILAVSSIAIAMRRKSIGPALRFDERFGLGREISAGEENIFLADALKAGLRLKYIPQVIVIHPERRPVPLGHPYFYTRGAVFKRLYGPFLGLAMGLLFCAKKSLFDKEAGLFKALGSFAQGFRVRVA